jgi:hypothetical protein
MRGLLAGAPEAHGGLENWGKVSKLTAKLSLGGPLLVGHQAAITRPSDRAA